MTLFSSIRLTGMLSLLMLVHCADFTATYENIVQDGKVRPLAVILDPPEAAPGDTVQVTLMLAEGSDDATIDWSVALGLSGGNYGEALEEHAVRDLDSMAFQDRQGNFSQRQFAFVVPTGADNPFRNSPMIPAQLPGYGPVEPLIAAVEADPQMLAQAGFADALRNFNAPILLKALVRDREYSVEVIKQLTVRYLGAIDSLSIVADGGIYDVNRNPGIDSIALVEMLDKNDTLPDHIDIADEARLTVHWFSTDSGIVDTFVMRSDRAYFLYTDSTGHAQQYLSPDNIMHSEDLLYSWFFTNVDARDDDWDRYVELSNPQANKTRNFIQFKPPADTSMHHFTIHAVVKDWRPEYGRLMGAGTGYLRARGYLTYGQ